MESLTHLEARHYLHAAVDGRLDAEARAALDVHLATCAECRAWAAELDALQLSLAHALHVRWNARTPPPDLPRKVLTHVRRTNIRQPIFKAAGALAGVAALIAIITLFSRLFGGPGAQPLSTPTALLTAQPTSLGSANRLIAFESERDGNAEIYVMRVDGGDQRNLTRHPAREVAPAWSPDGTRIAFISDRTGHPEIFVMNADGSGVTQLTNSPEAGWWTPLSWSPDGTRLALARVPVNFPNDREGVEIYLVNADGSGTAFVTQNRFNDFTPKWSPDGQRIAFIGLRYTTSVLYTINLDGTGLLTLGVSGGRNADLHDWSPDGRRLAYFSVSRLRYGDYGDEIRIVNADGSDEKVILTLDKPRRARYEGLAWSPDGTRLIFASDHEDNTEGYLGGLQQIYLLWADGSGLTRLTGAPANHTEPRWSPDDRWIAFTSDRDALSDIYVMNVVEAFRSPEELAPIWLTTTGKEHNPRWQPVAGPAPLAQSRPGPTPSVEPAIRILGVHQVQSGETLRCIASAYGVLPSAIADLNQLGEPPQLHIGPLLIPDVEGAARASGPVCSPQFPAPRAIDPVVTAPAPLAFPFELTGGRIRPQSNAVSAPLECRRNCLGPSSTGRIRPQSNAASAAGCDGMGMAGQAIARNGAPVAGLLVHLESTGPDREAVTGSRLEYGPGGYELQLDDHLTTTGLFRVQLRDPHGRPLSEWIPLETFADCGKNLLVNFIQR